MDIWNELSKVYNMNNVPDEAKSIIGDVMLAVSGQPEIIYCRECKFYDDAPCGIVDWYNTADDFCSYAERRE